MTNKPTLKPKKAKVKESQATKAKQELFGDLRRFIESKGFDVRREKLKTGAGWRTLSGTCTVKGKELIFIDSVLPIDDQLDFICQKIREVGETLPEEYLGRLPVYLRQK